MQLDETAAEMNKTAFSQKVARNISPLFYQDARRHYEQRKATTAAHCKVRTAPVVMALLLM